MVLTAVVWRLHHLCMKSPHHFIFPLQPNFVKITDEVCKNETFRFQGPQFRLMFKHNAHFEPCFAAACQGLGRGRRAVLTTRSCAQIEPLRRCIPRRAETVLLSWCTSQWGGWGVGACCTEQQRSDGPRQKHYRAFWHKGRTGEPCHIHGCNSGLYTKGKQFRSLVQQPVTRNLNVLYTSCNCQLVKATVAVQLRWTWTPRVT